MRVRLLVVWLVTWPALICTAGQALYQLRGGDLPLPVQTNGYRQEVVADSEGVRVRVTTQMTPLATQSPWSFDDQVQAAGARVEVDLPAELVARLRTAADGRTAASEVLEWVMSSIGFDEEDAGPQNAAAVLQRRRGRCAGLANLSVELLRAAGFQARPVSGLLIGSEGPIPHRWLECHLPGTGWVATDPTLGLWVVTPQHLAYPAPLHRLPAVEILVAADPTPVEVASRGGWLVRDGHGAELVCHLLARQHEDMMVVLRGPEGQHQSRWARDVTRFTSLIPGTWELSVEVNGRRVARRLLHLQRDQVHSIAIELEDETGRSS